MGWQQSKSDFQISASELIYESNGVRRIGEHSQNNDNKSLRFGLGFDYDFDKNNSLVFDLRGFQTLNVSYYNKFSTYQYLSPLGRLDSTFVTNSRTNYNTQSLNLYGGYIHKFKNNKLLTLNIQHIKYSSPDPISYQNISQSNNIYSITSIDTYPNSNQVIKAYNLNVELPTSKKYFWEMGAKLTSVNYQNQFNWFDIQENKAIENLDYRNDFIYKESIWAGYVSVRKTFGKYELSAGLRDEYTTSVGTNEGKDVNAIYNNLFPSFFFQKTISKEKQLGFSYTRRVQRPSYSEFNPKSLPFMGLLNLKTGNAYLTPQFIHALEANYLFKDLYMAVSFNRTENRRVSLPVGTEGKAIVSQIFNLDYLDNITFSINKPFRFFTWWQSTNSFQLYYHRSKLLDNSIIQANFWDFNTRHLFKISPKSSLEAFFAYSSPSTEQYTSLSSRQYLNVAYKTSFLDKRVDISIAVSDILGIRKVTFYNNTPFITSSSGGLSNGRMIRLTATYKFATTSKFDKKGQKTNDFGEVR